ncbi:hypothetical protein E0X81_08020 [Halomonas sp. GDM18]|nr:hypothetical protein E0X81_08020 [Halomonas sp. GDM18]
MKDILEIRSLLRLPPKIEEQLIDQGCLGKLYPERVGMEILMPTHKLFSFFRSAYTTNSIPLSYKNMSKHINNPTPSRSRISNTHPTQEASEIINATKLKQLKSWRSGVTPESDHLAEFLESLSGEKYSAFLPFFLCRITSMWNKFYVQEAASLKNEIERHKNLEKYIDEEWLLNTFATYTKYWQKNAQANTA